MQNFTQNIFSNTELIRSYYANPVEVQEVTKESVCRDMVSYTHGTIVSLDDLKEFDITNNLDLKVSKNWITALKIAEHLASFPHSTLFQKPCLLLEKPVDLKDFFKKFKEAECPTLFSLRIKNGNRPSHYLSSTDSYFDCSWYSIIKTEENLFLWAEDDRVVKIDEKILHDTLNAIFSKINHYFLYQTKIHPSQITTETLKKKKLFIKTVEAISEETLFDIVMKNSLPVQPTLPITLKADLTPTVYELLQTVEKYAQNPWGFAPEGDLEYLVVLNTHCGKTVQYLQNKVFKALDHEFYGYRSKIPLDLIDERMSFYHTTLKTNQWVLYKMEFDKHCKLVWPANSFFWISHTFLILQYKTNQEVRYLPLQSNLSAYRLKDWLEWRKTITQNGDASYSFDEFLKNFWNPLQSLTTRTIQSLEGQKTYCDLFLAPIKMQLQQAAKIEFLPERLITGCYYPFNPVSNNENAGACLNTHA
jgi:hypothetical protein